MSPSSAQIVRSTANARKLPAESLANVFALGRIKFNFSVVV